MKQILDWNDQQKNSGDQVQNHAMFPAEFRIANGLTRSSNFCTIVEVSFCDRNLFQDSQYLQCMILDAD